MRILRRTLCSISLILLLAISFMSLRSYFRGDCLRSYSRGKMHSISSVKGSIVFDATDHDPRSFRDGTQFGTTKKIYSSTFSPPKSWIERLGFWSIDMSGSSGPFFRIIIPYWPLVLIFAVLPADA